MIWKFHKHHQYWWSKFRPAPVSPLPFFVGIPDIFHPSLCIDKTDRPRILCLQELFPNVAAIISVGFMMKSTFSSHSAVISSCWLCSIFHNSLLSLPKDITNSFLSYDLLYYWHSTFGHIQKKYFFLKFQRLDSAIFLPVCILSCTAKFRSRQRA